jgi:hypothetical protein
VLLEPAGSLDKPEAGVGDVGRSPLLPPRQGHRSSEKHPRTAVSGIDDVELWCGVEGEGLPLHGGSPAQLCVKAEGPSHNLN